MGRIDEFISTMRRQNASTASVYNQRLKMLNDFSLAHYKVDMDNMLPALNESVNIYEFLNTYVEYLQYNHSLSPLTLKQNVITCKNFIEYNDVDVSPHKFKLKVKMKRVARIKKQPLSKEDIITIVNSCSEIRLKTYVMLLAASGMRAEEALSIRIRDIDFESRRLLLRGDSTKTKVERTVLLTEEVTKQIRAWLDFKYRIRRVQYHDKSNRKRINEYKAPSKNENALVFGIYKIKPDPHSIYTHLCREFNKTLDRIGMDVKEEFRENPHNKRRVVRRRITLHSFRRFVKSTISDLGYSDFSEYFIGHSGSTYYTQPDKEIENIFKKIEPHLTFLDFVTLQRKGADIESKISILEQENQRLRQTEEAMEEKHRLEMNNLEKKMEQRFTQVISMIKQNPLLAHVKPEVLTKKMQ
jgi:integrase